MVQCRSLAEGAADTLKAGTDMSCTGKCPALHSCISGIAPALPVMITPSVDSSTVGVGITFLEAG